MKLSGKQWVFSRAIRRKTEWKSTPQNCWFTVAATTIQGSQLPKPGSSSDNVWWCFDGGMGSHVQMPNVHGHFAFVVTSHTKTKCDYRQRNKTGYQTTLISAEQNTGLEVERLQARGQVWDRPVPLGHVVIESGPILWPRHREAGRYWKWRPRNRQWVH